MHSLLSPLVEWTDRGLYCQAGDFYIDPHRAVETAIVTHAHSDHARRGCQYYISARSGLRLLKSRLSQKIKVETYDYKETFTRGRAKISLHPAGHILGSAQVRIELDSEVWVVSGDYKREPDPSCEPFEPVPCDTFITEATFGTPKYVWDKVRNHGWDIYSWWIKNASTGKNSILFGYSLGKAQRILAELAPYANRPIVIHQSIAELTQCYRDEGRILASTIELEESLARGPLRGELILAPPSILQGAFLECFGEFETAFASGWVQGSSYVHGSSYDRGFVISDHADWNDLNQTIDETGAKQIFVLHRSNGVLVRYLRKKGLDAYPVTSLTRSQYQEISAVNLSLF